MERNGEGGHGGHSVREEEVTSVAKDCQRESIGKNALSEQCRHDTKPSLRKRCGQNLDN